MHVGAGPGEIALSALIGALSYALDVAEGEPPGHATRSCLIGMRLAEELGLDATARSDLFYALLLKDAGCSANAAHMAALFGADDQEAKRTSKRVDWARPFSAVVWSLRTVAPDGSLSDRIERLRAIRDEGEVTKKLMQARCDRGAEIARTLGFSQTTAAVNRGACAARRFRSRPGSCVRRRRLRSFTARTAWALPTEWRRSEAGAGSILGSLMPSAVSAQTRTSGHRWLSPT